MRKGLWSVAIVLLTAGSQARASEVVLRYEPPIQTVNLGDFFTVDIVADIATPVIGWGLDQTIVDPTILSLTGSPVIGPDWMPAFTPDGDGLGGLASPLAPINGSVMGTGIVLATLSLSADALGGTELMTSVSPNDLTEGFALDPSGFATVTFTLGFVTVIPEPSSVILLGLALSSLMIRRKRRKSPCCLPDFMTSLYS